jgi:hypothetical protein
MDVESVCGQVIETVLWIPWGPIFILNWLRCSYFLIAYSAQIFRRNIGWVIWLCHLNALVKLSIKKALLLFLLCRF